VKAQRSFPALSGGVRGLFLGRGLPQTRGRAPPGLHPHARPQGHHGKGGGAGGDAWASRNSSHSSGPGGSGVGEPGRAGLPLVPVPIPVPVPFPVPGSKPRPRRRPHPGTFLPRNASAPARPPPGARGAEGKMAAPMSEGFPAGEPGAAPYGNFPNYSRFHPPEGRVRLLPGGLLRSLFPAAARPLLGLDVGCNSGVRSRLGGRGGPGAGGSAGAVVGAVGKAGKTRGEALVRSVGGP